MSKFILIGMRGVGKTTVANAMITIQSIYTLYDTDTVFEMQNNTSVHSYILNHGIEAFRKHESIALQHIIHHTPSIISTGGGIVTIPGNRALLEQEKIKGNYIIFLHAPLDTLYKRRTLETVHDLRPLLYNTINISDEITVSWQKRKKWYYMLATHIIYTENKHPLEIAHEIFSL